MRNFDALKRRLDRIEQVLAPKEEVACNVVIFDPITKMVLPGYEHIADRPGPLLWIPDNGRDGYSKGYRG
ncbi:MAG TPA: hypothetical protein VEL31_12650 [Ktedonobacteraceae bacterium]|nr:hypothetical protein [Ktedonobacteraceae bacterium]